MAKTRSQIQNIKIKKEEEKYCVNDTTGNTSKITKRQASINKSSVLPEQKSKVDENTDAGSLFEPSPKLSERGKKKRYISQEQINQLIRYVVNDKISVSQAAFKLKIRCETASYYFNLYNNDPEKKIPIPLWQLKGTNACTQEQIVTLIKSIVDDGTTILAASAKANMNYDTGRRYYRKYLEDPKRTIPVKGHQESKQEQINKLISYIVDDKMTLSAASNKANMGYGASKRYYENYLNDPNHDIPTAHPHHNFGSPYTQEQKNRLISFIINDKMPIRAASRKAGISQTTGFKYYRRYLNEHPSTRRVCAQDKIKQLTGHSEKTTGTGQEHQPPTRKVESQPFSEEQINTLIRYIVDDKMTLVAASKKAKMSKSTGAKYYYRYLNDTPITNHPLYTQEQVTNLFRYIVEDKMSVEDASKKANMSKNSGRKSPIIHISY